MGKWVACRVIDVRNYLFADLNTSRGDLSCNKATRSHVLKWNYVSDCRHWTSLWQGRRKAPINPSVLGCRLRCTDVVCHVGNILCYNGLRLEMVNFTPLMTCVLGGSLNKQTNKQTNNRNGQFTSCWLLYMIHLKSYHFQSTNWSYTPCRLLYRTGI